MERMARHAGSDLETSREMEVDEAQAAAEKGALGKILLLARHYFANRGPAFMVSTASELESSMNSVQVEQKRYEMPPREGFTVAHFLTVTDIERSARFYETVFEGRIL